MIQLGRKPQCRNCVYFREALKDDWTWMHTSDGRNRHNCRCPGFEHIVTHSRNRCKNGQFIAVLDHPELDKYGDYD